MSKEESVNNVINKALGYDFNSFKKKLSGLFPKNPFAVYEVSNALSNLVYSAFETHKSLGGMINNSGLSFEAATDKIIEWFNLSENASLAIKKTIKDTCYYDITSVPLALKCPNEIIERNALIKEDNNISLEAFPEFLYNAFPESLSKFKTVKDVLLIKDSRDKPFNELLDNLSSAFNFISQPFERKVFESMIRTNIFEHARVYLDHTEEQLKNLSPGLYPDVEHAILAKAIAIPYFNSACVISAVDVVNDEVINGSEYTQVDKLIKGLTADLEKANSKKLTGKEKNKLALQMREYVKIVNSEVINFPDNILRDGIKKINESLNDVDPLSPVKKAWVNIESVLGKHDLLTDKLAIDPLINDLSDVLRKNNIKPDCLIEDIKCTIDEGLKSSVYTLKCDPDNTLSMQSCLAVQERINDVCKADNKGKYSSLKRYIRRDINKEDFLPKFIENVNAQKFLTGLSVSFETVPSRMLKSIINVHNYYRLLDVKSKEYGLINANDIKATRHPTDLSSKLINGDELLSLGSIYSLIKNESGIQSRAPVNDLVSNYIKMIGLPDNFLTRYSLKINGLM